MFDEITRRDFLKITAVGAGALTLGKFLKNNNSEGQKEHEENPPYDGEIVTIPLEDSQKLDDFMVNNIPGIKSSDVSAFRINADNSKVSVGRTGNSFSVVTGHSENGFPRMFILAGNNVTELQMNRTALTDHLAEVEWYIPGKEVSGEGSTHGELEGTQQVLWYQFEDGELKGSMRYKPPEEQLPSLVQNSGIEVSSVKLSANELPNETQAALFGKVL